MPLRRQLGQCNQKIAFHRFEPLPIPGRSTIVSISKKAGFTRSLRKAFMYGQYSIATAEVSSFSAYFQPHNGLSPGMPNPLARNGFKKPLI
jgi:hypothetical protein